MKIVSRAAVVFAAALLCAGVLSASAFAKAPSMVQISGPAHGKFSGTGSSVVLDGVNDETCSSSSEEGTLESEAGGTVKIVLKKCVALGGLYECPTIEINAHFAPVWLNKADTKVGILLSENGGPLAKYTCAGLSRVMTGSVIGRVTSPERTGEASNAFNLDFEVSGGKQIYEQVEETGEQHHLKLSISGGTAEPLTISYADPANFVSGTRFEFV